MSGCTGPAILTLVVTVPGDGTCRATLSGIEGLDMRVRRALVKAGLSRFLQRVSAEVEREAALDRLAQKMAGTAPALRPLRERKEREA